MCVDKRNIYSNTYKRKSEANFKTHLHQSIKVPLQYLHDRNSAIALVTDTDNGYALIDSTDTDSGYALIDSVNCGIDSLGKDDISTMFTKNMIHY